MPKLFIYSILLVVFPRIAIAISPDWESIFRVGRIDQSVDDLNVIPIADFETAFARLSQPLDAAEWPHIHPGVRDVWAGSKPHEFSINVPTAMRHGVYRIRIGVLGSHPGSPPELQASFGHTASWKMRTAPGVDLSDVDRRLETITPYVFEFHIAAADLQQKSTLLSVKSLGASSWVVYDGIEIDWRDESLPTRLGVEGDLEEALLVLRSPEGDRQRLSLELDLQAVSLPLAIRVSDANGAQWAETTLLAPSASRYYGPLTSVLVGHALSKPQKLTVSVTGSDVDHTQTIDWPGFRPIELFVVPQAHFDNGYTHTPEEATYRNMESLTRALDYGDRFDNFSWTNESSYILQRWWQGADKRDQDRLLSAVRAGKVGLDAGWVNLLTGLPTAEGLHRWLYWSGNFARTHRLDLKTASLTDSPSHVWSIPSILAKSGIEFLSIGSNSDRSEFWCFGEERSYQPVWWEGPDGARLLTMVHRHYAEATTVGLTASLELAEARLPSYIADLYREQPGKSPYPYDVIHLHGAYTDNVQLDENLPAVVSAWNEKYQWPKIRLGTNADFFERLRVEALEKAPVVSGDQGAYWEDGAASSAAETKLNRETVRRLAYIEAILAGLHARGLLQDYPRKIIDQAWENALLYDEHTWGAAASISRPAEPHTLTLFSVKAGYAVKASQLCDELFAIAKRYSSGVGDFTEPLTAISPGESGLTIESAHLAVTVNRNSGLIESILRKSDGREFVEDPDQTKADPAPAFGQVLYYAKPRSNPPSSGDRSIGSEITALEMVEVMRGSRSILSRMTHDVLGVVELETSLGSDSPTIEYVVRMLGKRPVYNLEGVYVAFPFDFKSPRIDYEVGGAVVQAGKHWMPHACLDWFSVQDFVRVFDATTKDCVVWSSWDAPLISLQDVNTHKALKSLPINNGRVFSYVMNNYWHTNYLAQQGGDFEFRYRMTFEKDLALGEAAAVSSRQSQQSTTNLSDVINVKAANVRLLSFKLAEDGAGYIVRLQEMDGLHGDATISVPCFPQGVGSATLVSGIEHPLPHPGAEIRWANNELTMHIHPYEIQTIRVAPLGTNGR
jgi:alpha-mannosidase